MMNKITGVKRKVLFLVLLLTMMLSIITYTVIANGSKESFKGYNLADSYSLNDIISLKNLSYVEGDVSYPASAKIIFPDGERAYSLSDNVKLDSVGEYSVELSAMVNDSYVIDYRTISVKSDAFYFDGTESTVSYGKDISNYKAPGEGLNIALATGEVFKTADTFNIYEFTKEDDFIKIYFVPDVVGQFDVSRLNIRLVDAYNPELYVQFYVSTYNANWCNKTVYVSTGFTDSDTVGYESYGEGKGTYHRNSYVYGTPLVVSMWGTSPASPAEGVGLGLRANFTPTSGSLYSGNTYIADYFDPSIFSPVFPGFTTGDVFVEIRGIGYATQSCKLFITKIGDLKLDNLEPQYDLESRFIVDCDENNVIRGIVNKPYRIYSAEVVNPYSENVTLYTKVWRDYYSGKKTEVDIVDGSFIPTKAGVYTIEYLSYDAFGVPSKKVIDVNVTEEDAPISLTYLSELQTQAYLGEETFIAKVSASGGLGDVSIETEITFNGKKIDFEFGKFIPEEAGTYTVKYIATDLIGQKVELTYDIIASEGNNLIIGKPALPRYFIVGQKYYLPNAFAHDYIANEDVKTAISVTDASGEKTISDFYVPSAESTQAMVKYYAEKNGRNGEYVAVIPIKNVKSGRNILLQNYFETDNSVLNLGNDFLMFAPAVENEDYGAEFINPLLDSSFSLNFRIPQNANNMEMVSIYLTDYADETKCVKLSLKKGEDKNDFTFLYLNGVNTYGYTNGGFYNGKSISLYYDYKTNSVYDGYSLNKKITTDIYGRSFNGFTSEKIYVKVMVEKVTGVSNIEFNSISSLFLSDLMKKDSVGPDIKVYGTYSSSYGKGDVLTIKRATSSDVLNSESYVTISIRDEEGNALTAKDGTLLNGAPCDKEYQVVLNNYEKYDLVYTAKDGVGIVNSITQAIYVRNTEAPTITISGKYNSTYNVGDSISKLNSTAVDFFGNKIDVNFYISKPDGQLVSLDKDFKFEMSGRYKIFAFAVDKDGIYSTKTFETYVLEGKK